MTRPTQIALIIVIALNGILLATWRTPGSLDDGLGAAVTALLLTIGTAVAVHLANEAADHETDRLTERTQFSGGSGALEASGLDPRVPLAIGLSVAAVVAVAAIAVTVTNLLAPVATALLLLGLAGGLAYSLPPVEVMRRGWGEPFNALLGSLLLPLFTLAAVAGTIAPFDVIAFLPFFFVTLASVMATAWPDRVADAATGKATMQVRFAPATLRRIHLLASGAFVVATLVAAVVGAMPLALAGLLVLPWLVVGIFRYTRSESPVANVSAMVGLTLITTATLTISLASRAGTA
ncbi:MAG: UbiA family prenyltransferase [Chloroflexota bacterium]|nr:UbiA family prenyltransferase [Chloroflexota bacterium]